MGKSRLALGNVRWAFQHNTPEEKILCTRCRLAGGPHCPKKKDLRPADQLTMIATRCVFFLLIKQQSVS